MSRISLSSQIAAVEAAIAGKTTINRSQADLQREHLQAAAQTLRWMQAHDSDIRAFVVSKRGAQS